MTRSRAEKYVGTRLIGGEPGEIMITLQISAGEEATKHSRERPSHLDAAAGSIPLPNKLRLSRNQKLLKNTKEWVGGWSRLKNLPQGAKPDLLHIQLA